MVIAKPILVTIVRPVPIRAFGAVSAFNVENCGESATTVNPQITITNIKISYGMSNRIGEIRQQIPETRSITKATFALPYTFEAYPPATHPSAPAPMITNDHVDTLKPEWLDSAYLSKIKGMKVQSAYNSHIWPKYPNAACLKSFSLKIFITALKLNPELLFL